jgi:predicted transcriptional regulator
MVHMAMTLRLTPEQDAKLTKLAAEQKISKQEAVALAVDEYVRRRAQVRGELLAHIVDGDRELLDLLAE